MEFTQGADLITSNKRKSSGMLVLPKARAVNKTATQVRQMLTKKRAQLYTANEGSKVPKQADNLISAIKTANNSTQQLTSRTNQ